MPRHSFCQLWEMVVEEGFFDTIKAQFRKGWDLGHGAASRLLGGDGGRVSVPEEPEGDPFSLPYLDHDPFADPSVDASAWYDDDVPNDDDLAYDLADDGGQPGEPATPSSLTHDRTFTKYRKHKPEKLVLTKKYYPFGAFSNFYIERPFPVRRRSRPGLKNKSKVGHDAVLRKLRQQFRRTGK